MTGLTPGAGNRSTPNRHGIRCRKSVIARAPSPSPSPEPTVRTIRVHRRPFAVLPFPSTNGANHTSLGYSPRNSHIETIQGLKARPIRSRHPPGHDTGPSALRSSHAQFLWRCHRLGWCRAVGPQTKRVVGPLLPQLQRCAQFASIGVHSRFFPSPAPTVRTIPAWGTAPGIRTLKRFKG